MRVLWFTNVLLPEAASKLGLPVYHKAGWLEAYVHALRTDRTVQLTVVTGSSGVARTQSVTIDGVDHVVLPCSATDRTLPLTPRHVQQYLGVVRSVSPDLIHFHGTELHYGMLQVAGHVEVPSVLSIQGLLTECSRVYFAGLSPRELWRAHTLREIAARSGIWGDWRYFTRRAALERLIIRGTRHIIGRTRWDRAHVRALNPSATYHHCEELLRPEFYVAQRQQSHVQRLSIFTPTASFPLKGFHVLLKAASLVKAQFPGIRIRVADSQAVHRRGNGYHRFLDRLIGDLQLSECIEWLGAQDATGMAKALSESHLFIAPSWIENRSNSLAEAMLVGVPAIASLAGGMTSTVKDKSTALCFPPGDHHLLAECIRMLFSDDVLAGRLSENAQVLARTRHDRKAVCKDLLAIYRTVAEDAWPNPVLS